MGQMKHSLVEMKLMGNRGAYPPEEGIQNAAPDYHVIDEVGEEALEDMMHTPPETPTVSKQVCPGNASEIQLAPEQIIQKPQEQQSPRDQQDLQAALTELEKKFAAERKAHWQSETTEAILHSSL